MDAIRIQIIRGCNADGTGGTVVDDASGVLGSLGNTPILDMLAAAFVQAYGLPEGMTTLRHISYRMRLYGTEILSAYAARVAAEQAAETARQQTAAAVAALTIVEHES